MIRRFLRVARPADWTGGAARAGVVVFGGLLWLYAILGRLPPGLRDLRFKAVAMAAGRLRGDPPRNCQNLAYLVD